MKMIVAFAALVAVALAAPQGHNHQGHYQGHPQGHQQEHHQGAVITKEVPSNNIGLGPYNYAYETSDGQTRQESAEVIHAGTDHESLSVRGSFSFVDPATNQQYTINYIADDNGFQPQGDHIPSV